MSIQHIYHYRLNSSIDIRTVARFPPVFTTIYQDICCCTTSRHISCIAGESKEELKLCMWVQKALALHWYIHLPTPNTQAYTHTQNHTETYTLFFPAELGSYLLRSWAVQVWSAVITRMLSLRRPAHHLLRHFVARKVCFYSRSVHSSALSRGFYCHPRG